MAIDLPPPLPPLLVSTEAIEVLQAEHGTVTRADLGDHHLRIIGNPGLADRDLQRIVGEAANLSDAVRGIAALLYREGYPAARVLYALSGRELYLLILPGSVTQVTGPHPLRGYFESLAGEDVLTAAALEPRRTLAAVYSDRSRRSARLGLQPGERPGEYQLSVQESPSTASPLSLRVQVGNPGNRFVGRNFGETEISVSGAGAEFRGQWREGLEHGGQSYRDAAVATSLVTAAGLWGIEGRGMHYTQASGSDDFQGQLSTLGVSWTFLPYADFSTRWLLNLRMDDVDDNVRGGPGSQPLLSQAYRSLEIGAERHQVWTQLQWPTELQLGFTARAGVQGQDKLTATDLDYRWYRPSVRLRTQPTAVAQWQLGVDASAQLSENHLPQQQQYVLGGVDNLSAWLPGVAVGDEGYYLRLQSDWSFTAGSWVVAPRAFAEYGSAHLHHADGIRAQQQTLASAGAEVVIKYARWLEASLLAATPVLDHGVTQDVLHAAEADAFFRIVLRY